MKKTKLLGALIAACALTISCAKKTAEELAAEIDSGDGSQTAAGLAGSGSTCSVFAAGSGTSLTGKGYTRALTLNADGTYTYTVYFSDHTGCTIPNTAGGSNIATYYQIGTFAVSGIATSPSNATKITFTPTTQQLTVRPSSAPGTGGEAAAMRDWLNGCSPSPGFTGGAADSTKSVADIASCGTNGGTHNLGDPLFSGAVISQIGYKSGSNLDTGARGNIWTPGALGTTFPTSFTETWGTYQ